MTVAGRGSTASVAIGIAGIGLTALWLWRGPAIVVAWAALDTGAQADAIFTVLMFTPLLLVALVGGALTRVAVLAPGARWASAAARGAGLGLGSLLLAAVYAALAGTVQRGTGGGVPLLLALGVLVVTMQAGIEEVLFRGWLQPLLARGMGEWAAVGVTAVVFALLHAIVGGIDGVSLLNLLLGGLLFGLLAARDRGIAGAVAAHVAYNAAEQLLLGLDPNPGTGSFGTVVDLDLVGPLRWGGSDVGLNASWATTCALLVILVLPAMRWRFAGARPLSATA